MDHELGIDVVRDLPYNDQGRCDDLLRVKGWEGAQELGGTVVVSFSKKM